MGWVIRIIFDPSTRQLGGGGFEGGDPWITFGSSWTILDHFARCTFNLCAKWSCGLGDHFSEVKLLEQVNFPYLIFFFSDTLLVQYVATWQKCNFQM